MTHRFFIIMGGFHLFERSSEEKSGTQQEDNVPLHPLLAENLVHDDVYTFTMPTEAEIKDRGKSDWLAKSLILLQTSWFVIQCIARAVKHLPVNHLEIVTLAYAAMNFVIYVLWWNKSLNVNRPVRVFRKSDVEEPISETRRSADVDLLDFIVGNQDKGVNLSHKDRVPRFWADNRDDAFFANVIVLGIGVCFGAIHCIAWHFSFPTQAELSIWRMSCVAITAVPIYMPLMLFFMGVGSDIIGAIALISAGILYILARVFTLALAFTSLRDLPTGAFDTVHWTTFIPHILLTFTHLLIIYICPALDTHVSPTRRYCVLDSHDKYNANSTGILHNTASLFDHFHQVSSLLQILLRCRNLLAMFSNVHHRGPNLLVHQDQVKWFSDRTASIKEKRTCEGTWRAQAEARYKTCQRACGTSSSEIATT